MDDRVKKLRAPDDCEKFAKNARALGHEDLALQAKHRAIELRAAAYGAKTDAERECLQAIYAYEEILSVKNGKRTRASRTWQAIKQHGILAAIERIVDRPDGTAGFTSLQEVGLENFAFEAVVLRHEGLFSEGAITRSRERMASIDA